MAAKKKSKIAGKAPKKPKVRRSSFTLWFLKWTFTLVLWVVIVGGVLFAVFGYSTPNVDSFVDLTRRPSVTIQAANGTTLATVGDLYGRPVTVEDVPPHLIQALLATEDRRFYEHNGIDYQGLVRAMVSNLLAMRVVEGGSTITQQLAKNMYLSHARTLDRKVQEAILALALERRFSKDEILNLYLNRVYLGAGVYGVAAAAERYFGKDVRALSLSESAMLVGLLKAPSRLNPLNSPDRAAERATVVLASMVDAGWLTPARAEAARDELYTPARGRVGSHQLYFTNWVMDELPKLIGFVAEDVIVTTTLDPSRQRAAVQAVRQVIDEDGLEFNIAQGALVSMAGDGAVLAMVGGYQFEFSQYNRVTQAQRQAGSAFKPVVALAALQRGYTAQSRLLDQPVRIAGWEPGNYDGRFRGEVSLTEAMTNSINVPFVRLAQAIGLRSIRQTAAALGIESPIRHDLSSALGSSEVNLLELTRAYATIGRLGRAIAPYGIVRVTSRGGEVLYEHRSASSWTSLDPDAIRALDGMLAAVVNRGTGRNAALPIRTAGKTGTSQDFRDAWFIGYAGDITTGVWFGNDDGSSMVDVTGGRFAARAWQQYMQRAINP